MTSYVISGIEVEFPYEAYPCQLRYMELVITALQKGQNALLESPTGTGKTLCLLCASLAWWKSYTAPLTQGETHDLAYRTKPRIIYASRTHSQLHQVIRELKATSYSSAVKFSILGSREQLCIHPKVSEMRGAVQNHGCRALVQSRQCGYHHRVAGVMESQSGSLQVMDIEDLLRVGKEQHVCPFYLSRELQLTADVVCVPYNYIVDPQARSSLNISWQNDIIIFDEAHNLDSVLCDASSFDLTSTQLGMSCNEIQHLITQLSSGESQTVDSVPLADLTRLKVMILNLESAIDALPLQHDSATNTVCCTRPGTFMLELFDKIMINHNTVDVFLGMLDQCVDMLLADETARHTGGLAGLAGAVRKVFRKDMRAADFRVHIKTDTPAQPAKQASARQVRTVSFWCFSPGVGMSELAQLGVRCIVLTSGTLAPLDSFAHDMRIPFPIRLENGHVVDPKQVWVGVLHKGPAGCVLNSSFKARDSAGYKNDLGNTIVQVCRAVADGVLVFFPSYSMLSQCVDAWSQQVVGSDGKQYPSIMGRIEKLKHVIVEPKGSAECAAAMADFRTKLDDQEKTGAVLFAICRGKVSEGLDFADRSGRAVLVVGLPYPPQFDARVVLKKQFMDDQRTSGNGMGGMTWYGQAAMRAVNQAIGRVLRHRRDYGAILLCDERFGSSQCVHGLSRWLQPLVQDHVAYAEAARSLAHFQRDMAAHPFALSREMDLARRATTQSSSSSVTSHGTIANTPDNTSHTSPSTALAVQPSSASQSPPSKRRRHAAITYDDTTRPYLVASAQSSRPSPYNTTPLHHCAGLPLSRQPTPSPTSHFSGNILQAYQANKSLANSSTKPHASLANLSSLLKAPPATSQHTTVVQSRAAPSPSPSPPATAIATATSSSSSILSKRELPRSSAEDLKVLIQEFLEQARSLSTPDKFNQFKTLLKQFRSGQLSLLELAAFLRTTFANQALLVDFQQFLPKPQHDEYCRLVGLSSNKSSLNKQPAPPAAAPPPPQQQKQEQLQQSLAPKGAANSERCAVCRGASVALASAKCGHVCCDACWQQQIFVRGQCPVCCVPVTSMTSLTSLSSQVLNNKNNRISPQQK